MRQFCQRGFGFDIFVQDCVTLDSSFNCEYRCITTLNPQETTSHLELTSADSVPSDTPPTISPDEDITLEPTRHQSQALTTVDEKRRTSSEFQSLPATTMDVQLTTETDRPLTTDYRFTTQREESETTETEKPYTTYPPPAVTTDQAKTPQNTDISTVTDEASINPTDGERITSPEAETTSVQDRRTTMEQPGEVHISIFINLSISNLPSRNAFNVISF